MMDDDVLILNDRSALRLIGRGNTAEIFLYDGCALMLFRDAFPESGVWKEWRVAQGAPSREVRLIGKNPLPLFTAGKKLGEIPSYGDNYGWNAELYLDGEPDEDKWRWLIPIKAEHDIKDKEM